MHRINIAAVAASAAGAVSEDAWGFAGDNQTGAAWVLDGATGLGDRQYIQGAYSDAQWYAQLLHQKLQQNSLSAAPIASIFADAIQYLASEWQRHTGTGELPRYVLPSAAGIWMRWRNGEAEIISVGDCRGWHVAPTGEITQLGLLNEDANDAWLAGQIAIHQQDGVPAYKMRDKVMDILRTARSMMNTDGGYDIFSIQPELAARLPVRHMKLTPGTIILCSDGLFRWSDVLLQGDVAEFLGACRKNLQDVVETVRRTEMQDADCTTFTRLKCHDDATGIVLHIE